MGQCLQTKSLLSPNDPSGRNDSLDLSFNNKEMDEWTINEVYNWLLSLEDGKLEPVAKQFENSQMNGLALKSIDHQYLMNKMKISMDDSNIIILKRDAVLTPQVSEQPKMANPATNVSLEIRMTPLKHGPSETKLKSPKIVVTAPELNQTVSESPTPPPVPTEMITNRNNEPTQDQQQQQRESPLDPSFLDELVEVGVSGLNGLSGPTLTTATFTKSISAYKQPPNPSPRKTNSAKPPSHINLFGDHKYGKKLTHAQLVIVQSKSQEENKEDDTKTNWNVNARIFIPKHPMPRLHRTSSAPMILSAIDEEKAVHPYSNDTMHTQRIHKKITTYNESKEDDNFGTTQFGVYDLTLINVEEKNKKQRRKKEVDPWKKYGAKGKIKISRKLTEEIIPNMIDEQIPDKRMWFDYMDKSTMMQRHDQKCKGDKIRILNYDFHDKNGEALYCIARKQNGSSNSNGTFYKWIMDERLYTAKDIVHQFGVVPESSREKIAFVAELHCKHEIEEAIRAKGNNNTPNVIISKTKWTKIAIKDKIDNKQRFILAISKTEFMKKIIEYIDNNNTVNLLPIIAFNINGHYQHHVEYIHIVRIAENVDIGISYKYENNKVQVTSICVQKEDILSRHILVSPHDCHCLDGFTSTIDTIKIGNVDDDKNHIKDLQRRLNIARGEISRLNAKIDKYEKGDNGRYLLPSDNALNSSPSTSPNGSTGTNTPSTYRQSSTNSSSTASSATGSSSNALNNNTKTKPTKN